MLLETTRWQWDVESFLRAEEAGIFGNRQVEFVHGEVRCVVHGTWHGTVRENVAGILRAAYLGSAWRSTSETLLLPNDAPDPDCWVRRRNAQPMSQHGRVARYDIADALLVVEIGDSSQSEDLGVMASMYGSAGVASYWVVTHDGVYVHRNPSTSGYLQRELVPTGGRLTLPESALTVAVDELLDVD